MRVIIKIISIEGSDNMQEQDNDLLRIECAKGVLMEPNGTLHFFGEQRYEFGFEITDENDHEASFNTSLADEEWFQNFTEQAGIPYEKKNNGSSVNIYQETAFWAGNGLVVIMNDSHLTARGAEYNRFLFLFPLHLSQEQQEVLEASYTGLKEMIERKHPYIDGMAYDREGNEAWEVERFNVDNLDEIYDRLNLNKTQGKKR